MVGLDMTVWLKTNISKQRTYSANEFTEFASRYEYIWDLPCNVSTLFTQTLISFLVIHVIPLALAHLQTLGLGLGLGLGIVVHGRATTEISEKDVREESARRT